MRTVDILVKRHIECCVGGCEHPFLPHAVSEMAMVGDSYRYTGRRLDPNAATGFHIMMSVVYHVAAMSLACYMAICHQRHVV